jgi:hypothetical protein
MLAINRGVKNSKNSRMTDDLGMTWKESGLTETMSGYLPGETEENHEITRSEQLMSQLRFESRLPHFLHNQLIDGGEVVRLTCRPPFTPQEDSWYSFLLEAESTPGP